MSIYGNAEKDRPSFNFEFSFGEKSRFDCYDDIETMIQPVGS